MAYNIKFLDLNMWRVWFAGQAYASKTVKTVKDWGVREDADICVNLGFFSMSTGAGCTYVHTPHGDLGYGGASSLLKFGEYSCRGYSNGITNGVVDVTSPLGGSALRNGIGITADSHAIIAQSTTKVTEKAFSQAVYKEAAKQGHKVMLFVLQDGGGSVSEYSGRSKLTFYPGGVRRVATVACANLVKPPEYTRVLRFGCRGEDVRLLQTVLGGIECDGIFGLGTRARVKAAQKALNIAVDGSCGPVTWKCLFESKRG